MSTVVAVNVHCYLSTLSGRVMDFCHSCILPWIFCCIQIDDVGSSDIKSTIVTIIEINSWASHIFIFKNLLAVVYPVSNVDKRGSHWKYWIWSLKPPEFCAYLPSPLSSVLIDINCFILQSRDIIIRNI